MEKKSLGMQKKQVSCSGACGDREKRLPPPIMPGACIGVVAPAGAPEPEALEAGLAEIERRGFRAKVAEQVYLRDALGFAGPALLRAETLMAFFEDPSIDAVWMARGGYGCMHLFPYLDARRLTACPKRCMGFSDITFLLAYFWKFCGMASFHGPVLTQLGRLSRKDQDAAFEAFMGRGDSPFSDLRCSHVLQPGWAAGPLLGGNLTILCHLLGTPLSPDFTGALLFFEDVREAAYRIDRMVCHLSMAGVLHQISGLLLGSFEGCGDPQEVYARILTHVPQDLPVVAGLPLGHGERNLPLAWGAEVVLDTQKKSLSWGGGYGCV